MDEYGPNEIKEVTISLWIVFLLQFTGTMPYMLEVAAIIAIICTDYIDFVIIAIMLIANASIGFHEKMKAAESLVRGLFFPVYYYRRGNSNLSSPIYLSTKYKARTNSKNGVEDNGVERWSCCTSPY